MSTRKAFHAGSWYSNQSDDLSNQLDSFLNKAQTQTFRDNTFGCIAPHAGYSYSGPTAAYSYKTLASRLDQAQTIFILGPLHHVYMNDQCALSTCHTLETPLGNLIVDRQITDQLKESGCFQELDQLEDEKEHSIEMQLPILVKVLGSRSVKVVPIYVGHLSSVSINKYAQALLPYFQQQGSFLIVSSDFCHWGPRFNYKWLSTDADFTGKAIWERIQDMDHEAMKIIENGSLKEFRAYLARTSNTICGQNPICIMLRLLELVGGKVDFLHYDQSSRCTSLSDNSVSYAAAVLYK